MLAPAEKLTGMGLHDEWRIIRRIDKVEGQTGGHFSVAYEVEDRQGKKAFLKALNLYSLIKAGHGDAVRLTSVMTESFVYERDILSLCIGMDRIIRLLSYGELEVDDISVPYLIFELAEGDIRKQLTITKHMDSAWILRTMHHVAVGVSQLHSKEIAHQDIKPSNILLFESVRKLGDFGRSVTKDCLLQHAKSSIAGDRAYAPPENLYGYVPSEWNDRRYGCDAYLVGSLLVFMLTKTPASPLLLSLIDDRYRPENWGGTYQDVLPYLHHTFLSVVDMACANIEKAVSDEIKLIITQLCHPDINLRGDPKKRSRIANPFSMESYISRFDRLAKQMEYRFTTGKP